MGGTAGHVSDLLPATQAPGVALQKEKGDGQWSHLRPLEKPFLVSLTGFGMKGLAGWLHAAFPTGRPGVQGKVERYRVRVLAFGSSRLTRGRHMQPTRSWTLFWTPRSLYPSYGSGSSLQDDGPIASFPEPCPRGETFLKNECGLSIRTCTKYRVCTLDLRAQFQSPSRPL